MAAVEQSSTRVKGASAAQFGGEQLHSAGGEAFLVGEIVLLRLVVHGSSGRGWTAPWRPVALLHVKTGKVASVRSAISQGSRHGHDLP